jgi:hypothetical protein
MRNISEKFVEKIKTRSLYLLIFFSENLAIYEIIWKNMVESGMAQMKIWRMRIASWIPTATDTQSE